MRVKFYDPHPGRGGPTAALPKAIKTLVDSYVGRETALEDLLTELSKIPRITCWAQYDDCYVVCRISEGGYTHQWRLIRWSDVL